MYRPLVLPRARRRGGARDDSEIDSERAGKMTRKPTRKGRKRDPETDATGKGQQEMARIPTRLGKGGENDSETDSERAAGPSDRAEGENGRTNATIKHRQQRAMMDNENDVN